jgi:hypothetical protein
MIVWPNGAFGSGKQPVPRKIIEKRLNKLIDQAIAVLRHISRNPSQRQPSAVRIGNAQGC